MLRFVEVEHHLNIVRTRLLMAIFCLRCAESTRQHTIIDLEINNALLRAIRKASKALKMLSNVKVLQELNMLRFAKVSLILEMLRHRCCRDRKPNTS